MIVLKCNDIVKNYHEIEVLKQLSLELHEREFLSLLGPSGCGKSTLLRIIAGLESLNDGSVFINNKLASDPSFSMPPHLRGVGLVFQDVALFPHLTVAENISFGLKGSTKENETRIGELLDLIDLPNYQDKLPHQISGGEQQRVALARALAPRPTLILLDEPFSSLDFQLRTKVRRELHRVLKNAGVSAILVTHDQTEAFSFSERVLVVKEGVIIQSGHPNEIYQNPIDPWVAAFVGESNFISQDLLSQLGVQSEPNSKNLSEEKKYLVRPENLEVEIIDANNPGNARVCEIEFGGDHYDLTVTILETDIKIQCKAPSDKDWVLNQIVKIKVNDYYSWDK